MKWRESSLWTPALAGSSPWLCSPSCFSCAAPTSDSPRWSRMATPLLWVWGWVNSKKREVNIPTKPRKRDIGCEEPGVQGILHMHQLHSYQLHMIGFEYPWSMLSPSSLDLWTSIHMGYHDWWNRTLGPLLQAILTILFAQRQTPDRDENLVTMVGYDSDGLIPGAFPWWDMFRAWFLVTIPQQLHNHHANHNQQCACLF